MLATISGVVFDDVDSSGTQDPGESGLEDRVVYLDTNGNRSVDFGEPVQLTSGDGSYQFEDLVPSLTPYKVQLYNGTLSQTITSPADGDPHQVLIQDSSDVFEASFGLTVAGDNNAPTSDPVEYEIAEDTAFIVLPGIGLVKDGQDADFVLGVRDKFIALQSSGSENGTIDIHPDGRIEYDYLENFVGDDIANYILHDGRSSSSEIVLTVEVTAVNDPPDGIQLVGNPLPENSPAGTVIGAINVNDPDLGDIFEIQIFDPRFQIADGLLILAPNVQIDFELEPNIVINVIAENLDNGEIVSEELTIIVLDVDDPVSGIGFSSVNPLTEGVPGLVVGQLFVEDQDAGQYTVSVDDDRFEVIFDGPSTATVQLVADAVLDFVDDNGSTLTLTLDDPANNGTPITAQITLEVINVNDSPTGINLSGVLQEHVLGATVGVISVVDPDPAEQHSYVVSDSRFEVSVAGVLMLKDDVSVDYDVETTVTLEITATDVGTPPLSVTSEFTIPVIENDAPWQNAPNSNDVNNDGTVDPIDALIILNELNNGGPRPLEGPFGGDNFIDVNGDGFLTPLDALIVVNDLNTSALSPQPDDSFPPIGESEEFVPAPDGLVPEGEAIAQEDPTQVPASGGKIQFKISGPPSTPAPLMAANRVASDTALEEEEDWLSPQLEEFFS